MYIDFHSRLIGAARLRRVRRAVVKNVEEEPVLSPVLTTTRKRRRIRGKTSTGDARNPLMHVD